MSETPKSAAAKIEAALRASDHPLTIDELCKAVSGRVGVRERNLVLVNLHRLDERGLLVKHPQSYEIKR